MTIGHDEQQRANLDKLATYLENLPEDYEHFEMSDYMDNSRISIERLTDYARHNGGVAACGTVACAIGHGPAAGILFEDEDFGKTYFPGVGTLDNAPDWSKYSLRFVDRQGEDMAFNWMFAGRWHTYDNTHRGAAARIRYYLDHGVPEGAEYYNLEKFCELYEEYIVHG